MKAQGSGRVCFHLRWSHLSNIGGRRWVDQRSGPPGLDCITWLSLISVHVKNDNLRESKSPVLRKNVIPYIYIYIIYIIYIYYIYIYLFFLGGGTFGRLSHPFGFANVCHPFQTIGELNLGRPSPRGCAIVEACDNLSGRLCLQCCECWKSPIPRYRIHMSKNVGWKTALLILWWTLIYSKIWGHSIS